MEPRFTRIADLGCCVVVPERPPELVVVLCHGFGAPGTDLVSLAPHVMGQSPALEGRVAWVFPEGPLGLPEYGPESRAWWNIDMARIQALQSAPAEVWEARREETPPGFNEARRKLNATLQALSVQWKLPFGRFVLGGFSQGAMLTTDLALRMEEAPAALVVYSGTLMMRTEWARRAALRRSLRVLQSHGRSDPILPFSEAERLRKLFEDAGVAVEFLPFNGPHTIAPPALVRLGEMLKSLLPPVG
jgi:phospholipase/carboxylesterase